MAGHNDSRVLMLQMQQRMNATSRRPSQQVDVNRFKQALANVAYGRPVSNHATSFATVPRQQPDYMPPWIDWKRIEAGAVKFSLGFLQNPHCFFPQDFLQYNEHQQAYRKDVNVENKIREANNASWEHHKNLLGIPSWTIDRMPCPNDGSSTVLGVPTIWTAAHLGPNPYREPAPWPCPDELKEEGDERHTSKFGRFLPVPRQVGNPTVNYKQKPFMTQETMDKVNPVPYGRILYPGLFFDDEGFAYDDDLQDGQEVSVDKTLLADSDNTYATGFDQQNFALGYGDLMPPKPYNMQLVLRDAQQSPHHELFLTHFNKDHGKSLRDRYAAEYAGHSTTESNSQGSSGPITNTSQRLRKKGAIGQLVTMSAESQQHNQRAGVNRVLAAHEHRMAATEGNRNTTASSCAPTILGHVLDSQPAKPSNDPTKSVGHIGDRHTLLKKNALAKTFNPGVQEFVPLGSSAQNIVQNTPTFGFQQQCNGTAYASSSEEHTLVSNDMSRRGTVASGMTFLSTSSRSGAPDIDYGVGALDEPIEEANFDDLVANVARYTLDEE